jgi:uncharacterized integral membrane protein
MAGGDPKTLPPLTPEEEFDDTPEELVGQLNEQEESEPDLQQVWDEIRQRRSTESPTKTDPIEATKRQELHQKELERSQQIADKVKTGKQVAQKTVTKGSEQAATNAVKEQAVKAGERSARAAARAAGEATKKAAKQAGKAIGQAIKKLVTQLLAKNPYVWLAVGIILLVIIIILIVVALASFSSNSGKGPARYPTSVSQQEQATLLSALSGDKIANDKTVKEVVEDEKDRYQRIKGNAQKHSADKVAAIDAKIVEFTPILDSLLKTSNKVERIKIRDDLQKKMLEFEGTLPFGTWIVANAKTHVGEPTGNFCRITGAPDKLACASFSSTTLWESGVPNAIVGTTTALWNNKVLRLVIDRAETASNERINEGVMRPGDIVWFGNGSRAQRRYAGALFDHVGIYIGNGKIIDSSSQTTTIKERPLTTHKFNGAKRYGAD